MPLFGKKKKENHPERNDRSVYEPNTESSTSSVNGNSQTCLAARKPKYSFQCQLAHGSPTGLISGFSNINELYTKIAECYDIAVDDILFCTLNTHKIDMERLLGSHIGLDDFIFVHVKGQKKEIDLKKTDESLGLTITDNGCGKAVIKRIRDGSQIQKLASGLIDVGDHIEKIDSDSFIGKRHYDVARKLRSISVNSTFVMRLISPQKSIYSNIKSRSEYSGVTPSIVSGKKTIRLSYNGQLIEEEPSVVTNLEDKAIKLIAGIVEKALGVSDTQMAQSILDMGKQSQNPLEFSNLINDNLSEFEFTQTLVNEFWGVVTDAKSGRLSNSSNGSNATQMTQIFEEKL